MGEPRPSVVMRPPTTGDGAQARANAGSPTDWRCDIPYPLSVAQLCMLRCLKGTSFEVALLAIFLRRCGLEEDGWQHLVTNGYARLRKGRVEITEEGLRLYKRRPKTLYF